MLCPHGDTYRFLFCGGRLRGGRVRLLRGRLLHGRLLCGRLRGCRRLHVLCHVQFHVLGQEVDFHHDELQELRAVGAIRHEGLVSNLPNSCPKRPDLLSTVELPRQSS
mmetsp:Transcript_18632/g.35862  ORF Transcript_18632/g.35862 Transcript_18632/m.35862 type:complete len:108 (+) Transcript_18632:11-334(+)